jgi:hypothetical protein
MAAKPNCVDIALDLKKLSKFETEELLALEQEIHSLMEAHKGDRGALEKDFKVVLANYKVDSKYRASSIIANKIKEERLSRYIFVEDDPKGIKGAYKKFIDLFDGDNSVESRTRTLANNYIQMLDSRMKEEGVSKKYYGGRGESDRLIYEEMWNQANGKPSVKDPDAVKMAKVLKEVNNVIYNDLRHAGLNVKYRKDHLISRNYNAEKMLNASSAEGIDAEKVWIKDMLAAIDDKATFSDATIKSDTREEILSTMYREIVSSQRVRSKTVVDQKKTYTAKLKSRKIEFKSGGHEFDLFKKYGTGQNVAEAMQYQIDRNAKTSANVAILGTNPSETFVRLHERYAKRFQKFEATETGFTAGVTKSIIHPDKLEEAFIETVMPPHIPSSLLRKAINFSRGLQAFSKLGSSIFSALYDANSIAVQYYKKTGSAQSIGYVKSMVNSARLLFNPKELQQLARVLNVNIAFHDIATAMGSNKGDFDTGYNWVNKMFKYGADATGVPFQTRISRVAGAIIQADAFHDTIHNIDTLNNFQKLALEDYKISFDDAKLIRDNAVGEAALNGTITPDSVMKIPLEKFDKDLGKARASRRELFIKTSNYINDSVQFGTPTPGLRVKRHLGKIRSQAKHKQMVELIMQFKETAWQIALANKSALDRAYEANGAGGAAAFGTEYMGLGFVSYMMFESFRAGITGKPMPLERLEDEGLTKTQFMEFIGKSSVLPVISDTIDAATSKYPMTNLTTYLGGPSLAMASELLKVPTTKDPTKASRKWLKRHVAPSSHFGYKFFERNVFKYDFITGERVRK